MYYKKDRYNKLKPTPLWCTASYSAILLTVISLIFFLPNCNYLQFIFNFKEQRYSLLAQAEIVTVVTFQVSVNSGINDQRHESLYSIFVCTTTV